VRSGNGECAETRSALDRDADGNQRAAVRDANAARLSTYGSVSAQTAPGATCTASARLPSGRDSTAQGLDTHDADANGNITWTYRTVSNTGAGTGTYTVSCSSGGQSKTVTAPFTVQ
jgi:hypothetical protein